jgi:DNA-binding Lrp family transcriptional regulator
MKAYVLLDTELGCEEQAIAELGRFEGIQNKYVVYGIHDIIVEIESENVDDVKKLVFEKIRPLKYVKNTSTLITY